MNIILRRWRLAPREYFALRPDKKNPDKPEQCRCMDLDRFFNGLVGTWVNYEDAIHNSTPGKLEECVDLVNAIIHHYPNEHCRFIKHKPMWNRHYKKGIPCPTNS